jgi:flagellar biosynthetic protein FliQ
MSQEAALGLGQQCMWLAAQIAAPLVLAGLIVGVLVSVFQAATQIQEQSLVFVPKVVSLLVVLSLCGGWMMARLVEFTHGVFMSLPHFVR